jgi:phospholipase/lecithinase/hemolysin
MSFVARVAALVKPWFFSVVLAIGLLAPQQAPADGIQRPFNRIVVFGDSLSDPGNAFALTGETVGPPDYGMTGAEVIALIPEAPYATRHFSNGVTWIELLAGAIGLGSSVKPAVPGALIGSDDGPASNYAVGGATAANIGVSQFHLGAQVDLFLSDVRGTAPSDALYVIAIGGNDVRVALAVPGVLDLALASVGDNIRKLHEAGARKFLIWNVPSLGRTPAIQRLDPFVCGAMVPPAAPGCLINGATAASEGYNFGLTLVLRQATRLLAGIEIVPFNTFASLEAIATNPHRFGLRDATTACIQPNVPPLFRCAAPDRHFFWDGIHPTRAGHAIIAFLVGKTLVAAVVHDD